MVDITTIGTFVAAFISKQFWSHSCNFKQAETCMEMKQTLGVLPHRGPLDTYWEGLTCLDLGEWRDRGRKSQTKWETKRSKWEAATQLIKSKTTSGGAAMHATRAHNLLHLFVWSFAFDIVWLHLLSVTLKLNKHAKFTWQIKYHSIHLLGTDCTPCQTSPMGMWRLSYLWPIPEMHCYHYHPLDPFQWTCPKVWDCNLSATGSCGKEPGQVEHSSVYDNGETDLACSWWYCVRWDHYEIEGVCVGTKRCFEYPPEVWWKKAAFRSKDQVEENYTKGTWSAVTVGDNWMTSLYNILTIWTLKIFGIQ